MAGRQLVMALVATLVVGVVGCSGGDAANSTHASDGGSAECTTDCGPATGAGGEAGSSAFPPVDGCIDAGFDPMASLELPALVPTLVVTTAADSGTGSLREALAAANDGDVVGFDPSLAGATIALNEQLEVNAAITIDGSLAPGITLDGQDTHRILSVNKNLDSTFVRLRFVRGRTDGSGGVLQVRQADMPKPERHVEIVGCTFEDNTAGRGGAVRIGWRVNAVVRNSVFRRNDGRDGPEEHRAFSGGAISTSQGASDGLRIRQCLFEDNLGFKAGGVYNILQPLEVTDSAFLRNQAVDGSGAVFTDGGNTKGPHNDPADGEVGSIALRRLWLERNVGQGAGGALLLWGYPGDTIVAEDLIALDNVCERDGDGDAKGGAVRIHAHHPVSIERSLFARNHAAQQGGAVWMDGRGVLDVVNTTFFENAVDSGIGGALVFNAEQDLNVESSAFVANQAPGGCGAIWWKSKEQRVFVRNTLLVNNDAGELTGQRHVRQPWPLDGGGNLEWVTSEPGKGRVFPEGLFVDPRLGSLGPVACTVGLPPGADSPVIDAGVEPAPAVDATGFSRDGKPDIGPLEVTPAR